MIAFWVLAPVMVAAALGLLFARKAVHAALMLAVVMIIATVMVMFLLRPDMASPSTKRVFIGFLWFLCRSTVVRRSPVAGQRPRP